MRLQDLIAEKRRENRRELEKWARSEPSDPLPHLTDPKLAAWRERVIRAQLARPALRAYEAAERRKGRGGRPPAHGDEHFRQVAEEYARALAAGEPPRVAVAERWNVSLSAAAKWIARARDSDKGFLDPTTRGKAGGIPPPKRGRKR